MTSAHSFSVNYSFGSLTAISDATGNLIESLSYDPWGRRRNPNDWNDYNVTSTLFDRGFTGHEHLPQFGLINMNGRMYDPFLARFLSPDPFVQAPDYSQNYNRYSYAFNNPLKYTDPDGEWAHLVVGAVIGGVVNWAANGAEFNAEGLKYFGVGALAGALGAGVGAGFGTLAAGSGSFGFMVPQGLAASGFAAGAAAGGSAGFSSGLVTGVGNSLLNGEDFSSALSEGVRSAAIGGLVGGFTGGISGGIRASRFGNDFWTGGEMAKVYRSPVGNNFGSRNGECALRCLEEFSDSYGMDQYEYDYWFKQNGSKLGVNPRELEEIIDGTGVFSSDRIFPEVNTIAKALSNDQRVLMGFNTDNGGAHAVMVNKVKIWPSGRYRIWFAETSPVRIAPYSTTSISNLGGAGFWTFFPR